MTNCSTSSSTVTAISGSATQAFLGLLIWLLLLAFVPVVGRFPRAAAVAEAVLKHLFTMWNY